MDNNSKKQAAKMLSLMERMDKTRSYDAAMLSESTILAESTRANVGSFLEFMTKYLIHKGPFIHLGYIQLYPVDTAYPSDEYYKDVTGTRGDFEDNSRNVARLDAWTDKMQNTEWNAPTGRMNSKRGMKAMANKLYPYIIKLTDYTLHWQSPDVYGQKASDAFNKLNAARDAMDDNTKAALGLRGGQSAPSPNGYHAVGDLGNYDVATFGAKDDAGNFTPVRNEYRTDPDDPNSVVPFERTAIRNYMSSVKDQHAVYFGVDEQGNIDPLPTALGKLLYNKSKKYDMSGISDQAQLKLAQEFAEIEKNVNSSNKTFLMQNVAYICGVATAPGSNKESVYWINENPLFLLQKEKTVNKVKTTFKYEYKNIDGEQLKAILSKYAKSEADEMSAKSNGNVNGQAMYADPNNM